MAIGIDDVLVERKIKTKLYGPMKTVDTRPQREKKTYAKSGECLVSDVWLLEKFMIHV